MHWRLASALGGVWTLFSKSTSNTNGSIFFVFLNIFSSQTDSLSVVLDFSSHDSFWPQNDRRSTDQGMAVAIGKNPPVK